MTPAEVRKSVLRALRQWRWRLLLQRLLVTLSASSVLVATALLLGTPASGILLQVGLLFFVFFAQRIYSRKWRCVTPENFLQHLNRRFPEFEESAQLLIREDATLTAMQKLQRNRAQAVFSKNLAKLPLWQPPISYRMAVVVILLFSLIAFASDQLGTIAQRWLTVTTALSTVASDKTGTARLKQISIDIQPPQYTGLPASKTDQPNLEIVAGSLVHWDLLFSESADSFSLELSDGQRIALSPDQQNHWHANSTINKTDLYRIIAKTAEHETSVGDIYTLGVIRDQAPDIRILEPGVSTLEIPKNGPPRFNSSVLIKDDYGVQSAEILASVAKGSGEGVKFRDQKLAFDQRMETDKGVLFQREWSLPALGMEPGDEIYFTVIATDNQQPEANTGRSATLIVRWLEDESSGLAAEGLAIDFIPEFFKSQRQIIIDTEQLIEDQKDLAVQQFKDTSYGIGQAQANLKHKYGQYLGDEFAEGPGEQLGIMHAIAEEHGGESGQADDGHDDDDHNQADTGLANKNLNTIADIVKLFGHDHGDPEIGPLTKRNPVALMKRAVSEMWQAEKHLMQAEPVLALPFEYEAYKYLKLARQADRIYVKRLGFEPPPVSEERRLTGELDEILSYQTLETADRYDRTGQRANQNLLRQSYLLLSRHDKNAKITDSQNELLSRLSAHLMLLSQQTPALIQQAASIEKLLLSGSFNLDDCGNCIHDLKKSLWNLMDAGDASLHHPRAVFYADDDLIKAYQQELQSWRTVDGSAGDQP